MRLTAKQAPHRPGISRGARFRATGDDFLIISQTDRSLKGDYHVVSHLVRFPEASAFTHVRPTAHGAVLRVANRLPAGLRLKHSKTAA